MATALTKGERREKATDAAWYRHMVHVHGMYRAEDKDARGAHRRKATQEELYLSTAERIDHGYAPHEIVTFTLDRNGAPLPRKATLTTCGTPETREWVVERLTLIGPKQPHEEEGGMAEQDGDQRDWCRISEAAMALKVEYDHMYRRVAKGQVRTRGLGRMREIPIKDFLEVLPRGGYNAEEIEAIAARLHAIIAAGREAS